MGKVVCPWDTLINFVTDAFVGYGIPREDAEICTDILLESDRRGIESHGCNRFKPIYLDRIKAGIALRLLTVMTEWARLSAINQCKWLLIRLKNTVWVW